MLDLESETLRLAQPALQALMASDLPVGLAVLDEQLRYCSINAELARANGLSIEAHLGRSVRDVLPAAADLVEPLLHRVLRQGEALRNFRIEAEVPSLPGQLSAWEASYLPLRDADGRVAGVLVQAINRTMEERLKAQQRDSEAHLRRVLDSLFVFVGVLSVDGHLLEANRAPLEAGGLSLDEVRGQLVWETPWWNHDPAQQQWLRGAVQRASAGEVSRRDIILRMAGDSRMAIDFMLAPLRDAQGRITHLIPSGMDISARHASERALADSEARYRRIFEGSTIGKALIDLQGRIVLANASMAAMFGYDSSAMEGIPVCSLVPALQASLQEMLMQAGVDDPQLRDMAQRQTFSALRRDGSEFPVEIALNAMPGGGALQVLMSIADITERRAAMQQIERALAEKTVLLNELHHRVKNNLQLISSLLSLQSAQSDEPVRRALRDTQSRVRSMALLHQLLFERSDLSVVDLGRYLQRLTGLLRDTYLGQAPQLQLEVLLPGEALLVGLEQAIPCGLMVNELVTNAIKHGFPDGQAGRVELRAECVEGGRQLRLRVDDDGIGLPPGLQLGSSSRGLGLQLLPLLAEQCQGSLAIHRREAGGTAAELLMPLMLVSTTGVHHD